MNRANVTGMTCAYCDASVGKASGVVPGFERAIEVSLEKELTVALGRVDVQAPIAAIQEEGDTKEGSA